MGAPTSLIISRPRHPFFKKTDIVPILMKDSEMLQIINSMKTGGCELIVDGCSKLLYHRVQKLHGKDNQTLGNPRFWAF